MARYITETPEAVYLTLLCAFQDFVDLKKKAEVVHVAVLLNFAACALKEKRFEDAIEYAEEVIRMSNKDVKALYRLGQVCNLPVPTVGGRYTHQVSTLFALFDKSPKRRT